MRECDPNSRVGGKYENGQLWLVWTQVAQNRNSVEFGKIQVENQEITIAIRRHEIPIASILFVARKSRRIVARRKRGARFFRGKNLAQYDKGLSAWRV
jgi:hypothetical protein